MGHILILTHPAPPDTLESVRFAAHLLCVAAALAAVDKSGAPDEVRTRLPALSSVYPQGWTPGAKLSVTVLGEYLDRTQAVVFLDPKIRGRVVEGSFTRLTLEFDVDAQAPLGPHYFRIVTPRGASNVLLFNANKCYTTQTSPPPAPPTNLTVVVN